MTGKVLIRYITATRRSDEFLTAARYKTVKLGTPPGRQGLVQCYNNSNIFVCYNFPQSLKPSVSNSYVSGFISSFMYFSQRLSKKKNPDADNALLFTLYDTARIGENTDISWQFHVYYKRVVCSLASVFPFYTPFFIKTVRIKKNPNQWCP